MSMSLADKLKELRKSKKVSQEKFAEYLGVSYQAVSKWENGITSPDISLLPDISRYFGITVDELLQAEKIDERTYFEECSRRSEEMFRNGKRIVRKHLTRAVECAVKSVNIKAHVLTHPLVYGWQIADAPTDTKQLIRALREEMMWQCYEAYRDKSWFAELISRLDAAG